MFLAGAVSASGRLNGLLVWLALGAGAFLGNLVNYRQGLAAGPAFKRRERWAPSIEKAEAFFGRHGARTVAIAAFVPFYRRLGSVRGGHGPNAVRPLRPLRAPSVPSAGSAPGPCSDASSARSRQ